MYALVRARFFRKWMYISLVIVIFILGNYYLFRGQQGSLTVEKSEDHGETLSPTDDEVEEVEPSRYDAEEKRKTEAREINVEVVTDPILPARNDAKDVHSPKHSQEEKSFKNFQYKIAVLVIACNRPAVSQCLDQIFKIKPQNIDMPVIVSQDCGHSETENVIRSYGNKLSLVKQPDLSDVQGVPSHMLHFMGYYKISRHYKFALEQAFKDPKIDSVIIIEDDLNIAPDFFEYFMATRPLLDKDKSLFCVSAWNDNGKEGYVKDKKILYRTDFFPGLGWMLTRRLWEELGPKWPLGFWDDWMRNPDQRKNRACIRPEISRSKTFGRIGVSQGQFYDQYLQYIELNKEFYPFTQRNLDYLLKINYDRDFLREVRSKPVVDVADVLNDSFKSDAVRILYSSNAEIVSLARQFGLMTDLKAGVPRTAYKGIVTFVRKDKRIYLTPQADWSGYVEN